MFKVGDRVVLKKECREDYEEFYEGFCGINMIDFVGKVLNVFDDIIYVEFGSLKITYWLYSDHFTLYNKPLNEEEIETRLKETNLSGDKGGCMKFKVGDKVILKEGFNEMYKYFYKVDIGDKIFEVVELIFKDELMRIKNDELDLCCFISHHFELYKKPLTKQEVEDGIRKILKKYYWDLDEPRYNKYESDIDIFDALGNFLSENGMKFKILKKCNTDWSADTFDCICFVYSYLNEDGEVELKTIDFKDKTKKY